MPITAPTTLTMAATQSGGANDFPVLVYKDANGGLAHVMSKWVINSSGILTPEPLDANGNPQVSLSGSNVGYSTDTKPTSAAKGDTFLEIDTENVYIYDGTKWVML